LEKNESEVEVDIAEFKVLRPNSIFKDWIEKYEVFKQLGRVVTQPTPDKLGIQAGRQHSKTTRRRSET
jgi:hypothetical protein